MRRLPRMRWRWLPRVRWLSRLRRMQSLPMRRRLWRLRWWLRRWLDRRARHRHRHRMWGLLCILGPVPLVLGNDAC